MYNGKDMLAIVICFIVLAGLMLWAGGMDVKNAHNKTKFCSTLSQEIGIDPNDNSDFLEECYNN